MLPASRGPTHDGFVHITGVIGMCMFLFCFAIVRKHVRPAAPTNDDLKIDLKDVWKYGQWVKILLLTLCNVCPGFIRMAATLYYVAWVMQQSMQFATLYQPWRCGHDDQQYAGEAINRSLVQTESLLLTNIILAIAGAMVGFLLARYGYDAGAKTQSDRANFFPRRISASPSTNNGLN